MNSPLQLILQFFRINVVLSLSLIYSDLYDSEKRLKVKRGNEQTKQSNSNEYSFASVCVEVQRQQKMEPFKIQDTVSDKID